MKHYVINLRRRPDRLALFKKQANHRFSYEVFAAIDGRDVGHLQQNVWPKWIDPILNREMNAGEIGCLVSHFALWQKCIELDEPIVIFEDDIQLLDYDPDTIERQLEDYDFIYLSRNLMSVDEPDMPGYSYWACAYALTPAAARHLVETNIMECMIPSDEYIPARLGVHPNPELHSLFGSAALRGRVYAHTPNICEPYSRTVLGSDIEEISCDSPKINVVTVASDTSKARALINSCKANNVKLEILGGGQPWLGGDMTGPGGGQKINYLYDYIQTLPDTSIVLFVDGYDVVIHEDLETIYERFISFNCDVLFAAEKHIWPDKSLAPLFSEPEVGYRYLNSGCFIGYVDALKSILLGHVEPSSDDQLFYQKAYLNCRTHVCKLDHEQYVFACFSGLSDYIHIRPNSQLLNAQTMCCPTIFHGNGGEEDKRRFWDIVETLGYTSNTPDFVPTTFYDVMDTDMLVVSFLESDQCQLLIEMAEKHGGWTPMPGDKFPAQEIRLWDISEELFKKLESHWNAYIKPICEDYWSPMMHHSIRDAFVMKYTMDTQRSLPLHQDASLVTASIKLNEDYEGADLVFPRQGKTNKDVPVGEAILFPGQVTHGHKCEELKSGVKYSLTIWTSRHTGDLNR